MVQSPEQGAPRVTLHFFMVQSLPVMRASTVLLALVTNLYELPCTTGFRMVDTRVPTLNGVLPAASYRYLPGTRDR